MKTWKKIMKNMEVIIRPKTSNNSIVKKDLGGGIEECVVLYLNNDAIASRDGKFHFFYNIFTNAMLEAYNITKEELFTIAETNTIKRSITKSIMGMLAITNDKCNFGAASIFDKELLDKMCDSCQDDLFVLPSSVHECIILPAKGLNYKNLCKTICEVNRTLPRKDVLADHPFFYSKSSGKVDFTGKNFTSRTA